MAKRQIANILGHVEYKRGKYRRVSNILAHVENKPAKLRQVSNIMAMVAIEPSITVTYDREAAAKRAIDLSRANFRAFADGGFPENYDDVASVVGKIERNGGRDYSQSLTHLEGFTGSAIYISECIYAGGMPMTVRPGANPTDPVCSSDDLLFYEGGYDANGWRICSNQQTATNTWKNHPGIIAYFTALSGGIGGQALSESIFLNDIVDVIRQAPDGTGNSGYLQESNPNYSAARDALINKFNSTPLNTLEAGDYIYVVNPNDDEDNHGFLIVGWGPLLGTQDGIAYARDTENPLSITRADPDHIIPYVADFCFGTKEVPDPLKLDSENKDDRTGWLQDPRARPFYSTHVHILENYLLFDQVNYLKRIHQPDLAGPVIAVYQEFNFNQWSFYKLPDTVSIPYGRIFFP